jgi:hypothetical protein
MDMPSPRPSCTSASEAIGPWFERYPSNSGPVRCGRSYASSSTPAPSRSVVCISVRSSFRAIHPPCVDQQNILMST